MNVGDGVRDVDSGRYVGYEEEFRFRCKYRGYLK